MLSKRLLRPALRRTMSVTAASSSLPCGGVPTGRYSWMLRCCSSGSGTASGGSAAAAARAEAVSAVNVEAFTLNDDVVRRDLAHMERWNALSAEVDAARTAGDHAAVLRHVEVGLAMLRDGGAAHAPMQCESLLCMEASQAHYNLTEYDEALRCAEQARESLLRDCKPELQDKAQIAEIEVFMGFTLCKQGGHDAAVEAQELLQRVLHWVDVDAKTAMPMQAVAAVNLRRSVLTGLGLSATTMATALLEKGETAEAKERFAAALDTLIEALNQHIDENDFQLVKSTLEAILSCFEGLGDVSQAVTTCRKYISWCKRHDDASGVTDGEALLTAVCARHKIDNPLEAERAAAAAAEATAAGAETR